MAWAGSCQAAVLFHWFVSAAVPGQRFGVLWSAAGDKVTCSRESQTIHTLKASD